METGGGGRGVTSWEGGVGVKLGLDCGGLVGGVVMSRVGPGYRAALQRGGRGHDVRGGARAGPGRAGAVSRAGRVAEEKVGLCRPGAGLRAKWAGRAVKGLGGETGLHWAGRGLH